MGVVEVDRNSREKHACCAAAQGGGEQQMVKRNKMHANSLHFAGGSSRHDE